MPLKVYIGEKFSHKHETEIFNSLIKKLKEKYDDSEELIVLIGNYYYNNQEIDATILKKDAIIVIDFKKYGGKIKFSENGKWFAGDIEVKGGNKRNPFIQLRTNKFALVNFFKNNHLEICEAKRIFNDLYISAMVIFHNDIEFSTKSLPINLRNWFYVTDFKRCIYILSGISENNINFTKKEIDNIINILGVNDYFSFDKQEEIVVPATISLKPDYELTKSQQESLTHIANFIDDKEKKIFILNGAAGTGKTYLIREIVSLLLEKEKSDFKILAPTGRAASNIRGKIIHDIRTIHSLVYERNPDKDVEIEYVETENSNLKSKEQDEEPKIYELHFDVRKNTDLESTFYIIDECSLLTDNYYKNDIFNFGSNKLLSDVFQYVNLHKTDKKIILIGDDKQIHRGKQNTGSLNSKYLEKEYNITPDIFELKDVVRYKENSLILKNSLRIRKSIEECKYNEFKIETDGNSIIEINEDNIRDKYTHLEKESTIILKYTNKSCSITNMSVKSHYSSKNSEIAVGDIIMFYKNYFFNKTNAISGFANYDNIQNGEMGIIKWISEQPEIINQKIITKEVPIQLAFRDIKVEILNSKEYTLKIFENFLNSDEPYITHDELVALIVLFSKTYFKKHNIYPTPKKIGAKAYYEAIQADEHFNSARVKYGYAITCHKAQGSEWRNVIVDFKGWSGHKDEFFRWAYTAITRATEKLFIMNEPHIHPYSELNIVDNNSPFDFSINNLFLFNKCDTIKQEVQELAVLNSIPEHEKEIKYLLAFMYDLLSRNNIIIDKSELNAKGYYIRFYLKTSDKTVVLNFIFDKERNFLKPTIIKKSTNDIDFANKTIEFICNNNYSFDIKKAVETCETDLVKSFIIHLFEKMSKRFIKILSIEHLNFKERMIFKKNNDSCIIDFYYVNDGFITSTQIIKSTSNDFKEELKIIMAEFKNNNIN